ncbi:MAG: adenylate/guanylate cyclase domain-containing protein [Leptospira sp.]|nr:adenylate/guanylate cyclase domain-containing protein [Leptospira sp.]
MKEKQKSEEYLKFQEDFYFEVFKSERIRVTLIACFAAFAFTLWAIIGVFFSDAFDQKVGIRFPIRYMLIILGLLAAYEIFVIFLLSHCINKRIHLPEPGKFMNAFIEISIPSIFIYFLVQAAGPIVPFHSPLKLLYFLLIVLSVLRLNFFLSFFTGTVAAIEYFTLAVIYLPVGQSLFPELPLFFKSYVPVIFNAIFMLFAGLAGGFVSNELAKRLVASLQLTQERNHIVGMFGQYVSPSVVEKLLAQKTEIPAETRHVCIMFLDIRNFTSFAESRSPEEVINYLNFLFSNLIDIVNKNNGIINKFLGDGFMAVFGAPLSDEGRDVKNAVKASMEIVGALEKLNLNGSIPDTKIGIGLNAGEAMTGNVGSMERKEYTIIGDTVNLASRVEQLTKQYDSILLVTVSVYEQVSGLYPGTKLAPVKVKGRIEDVQVYKLI